MNRRNLILAVGAAALAPPTFSQAQSTPEVIQNTRDLLVEYLYQVVQYGDLDALDRLFDLPASQMDTLREFHEQEKSRLESLNQSPSSQLWLTVQEGKRVMAHGLRNGQEVVYSVQASNGAIATLSIINASTSEVF